MMFTVLLMVLRLIMMFTVLLMCVEADNDVYCVVVDVDVC